MIKREKIRALVLSRRDSGEADRLLTVFSREHGLLRLEARGVRKIPSRRGGHLEPFTQIIGVVSSGHRNYVAGAETVQLYGALRADAQSLAHVEPIASLLVQQLPESERHPTLFDALHDAWQMMPTLPAEKKRLLEIALTQFVFAVAGEQPQLVACEACGSSTPTEAVVLDGKLGGWRCLSCHGALAGAATSLSPRLLKALRWITENPQRALSLRVTDEESKQLLSAVRSYVLAALESVVRQPHFT